MSKYHKSTESPIEKKFKSTWIADDFGVETIEFAENFGEYLAKNRLTTSQIRNIFGEVKRIQINYNDYSENNKDFFKDFLLLRPKIAYAAKRAGSRGIEAFKNVMDKAHFSVTSADDKSKAFQNFVDFFEAILAYHKANGGRNQ